MMKRKYIMALDQGTTSARCILYDRQGRQISSAQKEFTQIYPEAGWVEHDPMEIWSTQIGVAQEAMLKIDATYRDIDSIGITNQRETTVIWDRNTGEPVYNAIVWQCCRSGGQVQGKDRSAYRSVFFGYQDQMDTGKCAGCIPACPQRGTALRDCGDMADMETHRRPGACDGLFQCIAYNDVQYT